MKTNKLLIIPGLLVTITLLTGVVLSSTLTHADGNTDVVDELDITVNSACTMKGGPNGTDDSGSSTYTTTINAGNYTELSGSKLVTLCNDSAGYAIYAIGYSGDSYDSETHTDLIGTATTGNIQTGTSGNNSYWAMKLEAVEGLTPPSIVTDFQNYHVIPDTYTKVASYTAPTATASDAGATVQTKYKINISKTQLAGAYNGKVKYTMVHPNDAPAPSTKLYMQDLTLADCQSSASSDNLTVTDRRDDNEYAVRYINGACWMTQNLRFTGTSLSTTTSNVSANITISYGDLTSGNSFIEARIHNSDDTTKGVWYNFCAAGAKETGACTDSSKYTSSYDICPKNWHLPTESQFYRIRSYKDAFSPVTGGYYVNGSLRNTNTGSWWSATAATGVSEQYRLNYDGGSLDTSTITKYGGRYVRCVRSS